MRKLFVSLPMNGRSDDEVWADMLAAKEEFEKKNGEDVILIDQFHAAPNKRLYYLGHSLERMSEADVVYFVGNWWNEKGCQIEYMAAKMYSVDIEIQENEADVINDISWSSEEIARAIQEAFDEKGDGPDENRKFLLMKDAFLKAGLTYDIFRLMIDRNESIMGRELAMATVKQLIDRNPLTILTNEPDDWTDKVESNGCLYFVHRRLDALFKMVEPDGTETFVDTRRYHCIDVNDPLKKPYQGGLGAKVFNTMVPIEFPYYPEGGKWTVYTEEFKYDENAPESDTFWVVGFVSPNGQRKEARVFFAKNPESGDWDYISKEEYRKRRKVWEEREGTDE